MSNTSVDVTAEPLRNKEQQVFEAWAAVQEPPYNCQQYSTGKYRMTETRAAWQVWQASRATEHARILSILENLTLYPGTAQANITQIHAAIASSGAAAS